MKRISFVLAFSLFVATAWAQIGISPSTPVPVNGGATQTFTCTGSCSGATWTLVTGSGSINSSTGVYTAPSTVHPQQTSRGVQLLPNNSPFNIPVNSLSVSAKSALWMSRISQGANLGQSSTLKFYPEVPTLGPDVPATNSTGTQKMHFFYASNSTGYQDAYFPLPLPPTVQMQSGWSLPALGYDRHLIVSNRSNSGTASSTESELYNLYEDYITSHFTAGNPTGLSWTTNTVYTPAQLVWVYVDNCVNSSLNTGYQMTVTSATTGTLPVNTTSTGVAGCVAYALNDGYECQTCNSQSGQQFSSGSYAQLGGVNAAGTPINGCAVHNQEWYAAVQAGSTDLGHAICTTGSNQYWSARFLWPATLNAYGVSGFQNSLTSCTNANPTVCNTASDISQGAPCNNYTYTAGCTFHVTNYGLTGNWTPLNGDQTATAIDNYHFSMPINATSFGAFTGSSPYTLDDFMPYGTTMRLKSSFNVSTFCSNATPGCPEAKVILGTIQKYGLIVSDGTIPSDNWDSYDIGGEFHPTDIVLGAQLLESQFGNGNPYGHIDQYLEVPDRSSQQLSTNPNFWQQTATNQVTVKVCNSGSQCATNDVILQGTAMGTDQERLTIAASDNYSANLWVTGNTNTGYTLTNGGLCGAALSGLTFSGNVFQMPACTTTQNGWVTGTPSADSTFHLCIEVTCLPVSADGSYRLAVGNYSGNYTDHTTNCSGAGCVWWGSTTAQGFDNFLEVPGLAWGAQDGPWQGYSPCSADPWTGTDSQLYSRSTQGIGLGPEDTPVTVALPNGTYTVKGYFEPGYNGTASGNLCPQSPGKNVFDWEVQGNVASPYVDGYVAAGNQSWKGFNLQTTATVSNGLLYITSRQRAGSNYGSSMSSILITPSSMTLAICTTSLPAGTYGVTYNQTLCGTGGTPPYTWSISAGSLPTGLSLAASTGVISGIPTSIGTSTFTVKLCDSVPNCVTAGLSITINPNVTITPTTLPNGITGHSYGTQVLTAHGGTAPYTWAITACFPGCVGGNIPGLSFTTTSPTTAQFTGTPTLPGYFSIVVKATDSTSASGSQAYLVHIVSGSSAIGHVRNGTVQRDVQR